MSRKNENKEKGKSGEDKAQEHLEEKGYTIIEKNWKSKMGELDIVALHKNTIIFVEVKAKSGDRFGTPEEMFGKRKQKQVYRISQLYLLKNKSYINYKKRIDLLCVVFGSGEVADRITHYENIPIG